jgi:hypothetical protein
MHNRKTYSKFDSMKTSQDLSGVRQLPAKIAELTSSCTCCGSPCREEDEFCSRRCENNSQGGFERYSKKCEWDG